MDKEYQDLLVKIPEKDKKKLEDAHQKLETAQKENKKAEADTALAEIKTMLGAITVEGAEGDALQKLKTAYEAKAQTTIAAIKSEVDAVEKAVKTTKNPETTVVTAKKKESFWPSWLSFLGSGPEEAVDTRPLSQQADTALNDAGNEIEAKLNEGKGLLDSAISGVSNWRTEVADFFSFTDSPKDPSKDPGAEPTQPTT